MAETEYTIAEADRCRFVFLSHARAVVHLQELNAKEVRDFAALAVEVAPVEEKDPVRLALAEDAGPRFRALWHAHMQRLKATDSETDAQDSLESPQENVPEDPSDEEPPQD